MLGQKNTELDWPNTKTKKCFPANNHIQRNIMLDRDRDPNSYEWTMNRDADTIFPEKTRDGDPSKQSDLIRPTSKNLHGYFFPYKVGFLPVVTQVITPISRVITNLSNPSYPKTNGFWTWEVKRKLIWTKPSWLGIAVITPRKSNELIPKIAMFKGSYLFQGPSFGVSSR